MDISKSIKSQEEIVNEEITKLNLMKSIDISKTFTEDYFHELCETYQWEYHKTKGKESRWDDKRKFYVDQSTSPSDKDKAAYDSYTRFKIIKVYDTAQEAIDNESNREGYFGDRFGFISKDECQKYCDMINKES